MREKLKNLTIGVLAGGRSEEKDISVKTGNAVFNALKSGGYNALLFDLDENFTVNLKNIDVCFIALHGTYGEDGRVQGALEILGVPYTGSGVLASALAMDKVKSKALFNFYGLKTPPSIVIEKKNVESAVNEISQNFEPPYFVKPNASGSSIGCSIVESGGSVGDLRTALNNAFNYDDEILVEKYIKGREIQFAWAFGKALGCVEVKPKDCFYSYTAKYTKGKTEYLINPSLTEQEYKACESAAVKANEIIGCRGVTRADIILSDDGAAYVLELNTLPGMTELSLVPMIAESKGMSFIELIENIIEDAVAKK
ncbi:MAG: D-alanine--D-alanine ligase [Candidatus Acidulodesulfobacterium acidiphilum]|uniref:D-alanine--D-alanine ligase n=1 Tax=Candidatus Acidulodesulfobacterium acidiphilum TaxID=2597224 RepID=A0A520X5M8_9DELT|nr:MAG: D-alanine--D-alanine ligase [Candidatus Acidulodesulfobacterium acidiphilum]